MQKKRTLLYVLIAFSILNVKAQEYFSFYQLRDYVPQTQSISPAHIPKNVFTFAIPGANFGINFQNDFRIKDLLVEDSQSGLLQIDLDNLLLNVDNKSQANIDFTGHLLHLGLRSGKNAFSVFVNAKATINRQFNKGFYDFLVNGVEAGKTITLDNKFNATSYYEIGFGYARAFLNNKLKLGLNLKLLNGLFHGSIQDDAQITLLAEQETFNWVATAQNASANTAGIDLILNEDDYPNTDLTSYLLQNKNKGAAFDIGGSYQFTEKFSVELSINDIGGITWKETIINYNVEDGGGTFNGLDLKDLDDAAQTLEDELKAIFTTTETQKSFKSKLGVKTYISASYQLTEHNRFSVSSFNNHIFGTYKPSYAVAYNRTLKRSSFGLLTSFGGYKKSAGLGANFVVSLGPLQMYMAADNVLLPNKVEDLYGADFRFGMNLEFGYYKKPRKEKKKKSDKPKTVSILPPKVEELEAIPDDEPVKEKIVLVEETPKIIPPPVSDPVVVEEVKPDPKPESEFYTVVKGDTLSSIARNFYGDTMMYQLIFEANRPLLKSVHLIYSGQVLHIPYLKD